MKQSSKFEMPCATLQKHFKNKFFPDNIKLLLLNQKRTPSEVMIYHLMKNVLDTNKKILYFGLDSKFNIPQSQGLKLDHSKIKIAQYTMIDPTSSVVIHIDNLVKKHFDNNSFLFIDVSTDFLDKVNNGRSIVSAFYNIFKNKNNIIVNINNKKRDLKPTSIKYVQYMMDAQFSLIAEHDNVKMSIVKYRYDTNKVDTNYSIKIPLDQNRTIDPYKDLILHALDLNILKYSVASSAYTYNGTSNVFINGYPITVDGILKSINESNFNILKDEVLERLL